MVERLDEERLETLRTWGAGLSTNARDELRASGKAILMLVDEIDRLEADLWNARAEAKQAASKAATAEAAAVPVEPPVPDPQPVSPPLSPARKPNQPTPAPTAKPSQVLAMTLSERIAQGRPTEPAT